MPEHSIKAGKTKRQWHCYLMPFATAVEQTAVQHNMRDYGAVGETIADRPTSDVANTFRKLRAAKGVK